MLQSSGPGSGTWVPATVTNCPVFLGQRGFLGCGTLHAENQEKDLVTLQSQLWPCLMAWLYDLGQECLMLFGVTGNGAWGVGDSACACQLNNYHPGLPLGLVGVRGWGGASSRLGTPGVGEREEEGPAAGRGPCQRRAGCRGEEPGLEGPRRPCSERPPPMVRVELWERRGEPAWLCCRRLTLDTCWGTGHCSRALLLALWSTHLLVPGTAQGYRDQLDPCGGN